VKAGKKLNSQKFVKTWLPWRRTMRLVGIETAEGEGEEEGYGDEF